MCNIALWLQMKYSLAFAFETKETCGCKHRKFCNISSVHHLFTGPDLANLVVIFLSVLLRHSKTANIRWRRSEIALCKTAATMKRKAAAAWSQQLNIKIIMLVAFPLLAAAAWSQQYKIKIKMPARLKRGVKKIMAMAL